MRATAVVLVLLADCAAPRARSAAPRAADAAAPTALDAAARRRDAATAPKVAALLDAFENFGAVLSPDGTRVLFRSDRGGIPELYLGEVARPDAPARKLVAGPERVASAVFSPDGRAIYYRQDRGADENFHIYRVGLDGSGRTDLTPGEPLWRDHPLLPAARPDRMIFSGRKGSDYTSMIFVEELATRAIRTAFRDPAAGTAIDVSPDGTRALWVHEARSGGHELFEVELDGGRARRLSPADGRPARVTAAAYSSDGARVYVATDQGGESHVLLALDRVTLAPVAVYHQTTPATAEVSAVVPSPRGDVVAIAVDAGDHSFVRLLDAATLAVRAEVKTPLGAAVLGTQTEARFALGAGTFTADGARFAIGLSTPSQPDDVYAVDAASGEVAPLRRDPRPSLAALPPITASIEHVRAADGLELPVNVYLPAGARRLPTIVSFHGGPDASSTLEWNAWIRVFTSFGFAVVEPNVRGSTGFGRAFAMADDRDKRKDAIADVAQVNAWARAQPWCDPARLVIFGASYGGYLVLVGLTRQAALWRAGVDLAGISDLMTLLTSASAPARYVAEFGDVVRDRALIEAYSPIHDADQIVAPLFVYQGQNDARVPRAQADQMVRALRRRHVPVEYMVAMNEGHTVAHRENRIELLTRVLRFLDDELGRAR